MNTSPFLVNKILSRSSSPSISLSERNLVEQFGGYLANTEDIQIIVISNYRYYDMPYKTRWSSSYKKQMIAKMYGVEDYCKRSGKSVVTLLTLTGYQDGELSREVKGKVTSRDELFAELKQGWHLLSDLMGKVCPGLEMVWVVEPHKSGYPHMHVAVMGYIPPEMRERLTRLWSEKYCVGSAEHGINFSVKSVKESVQSIRNYLMKYISKGIGASGVKSWSPEEWVYHALAWKHHYRYIGMSRSISRYCTARKFRYKFRKYIRDLTGGVSDPGLPELPVDRDGLDKMIRQFRWRAPHDQPPPDEKERWSCTFINSNGTL